MRKQSGSALLNVRGIAKLFALMAVCVLSAGLLAGCGGSKPAEAPAGDQKSTMNADQVNKEAAKEKNPEGGK